MLGIKTDHAAVGISFWASLVFSWSFWGRFWQKIQCTAASAEPSPTAQGYTGLRPGSERVNQNPAADLLRSASC
jgi:hypothetical protein